MKNMQFFVRNCVLVAALFFMPIHSHSNKEGISGGQAAVMIAGVLVVAYGVHYGMQYGLSQYHENELNRVRISIDSNSAIDYEKIPYGENDESIKSDVEKYKKDLNEKWILHHNHGLTLSGSANFSGRMSAANIYCLWLGLSGEGFVKTVQ